MARVLETTRRTAHSFDADEAATARAILPERPVTATNCERIPDILALATETVVHEVSLEFGSFPGARNADQPAGHTDRPRDVEADAISSDKPTPLAAMERGFVGYIDGPDAKWRVIGWARALQPNASDAVRLGIRLLENGVEIVAATAERFRGDLLAAGIGDGSYGFLLPLPARMFDGLRHLFEIRVTGATGPDLLGELDIALPSRAPAMLEPQGFVAQTAKALVQKALRPRRSNINHDIHAYAAELTLTMKDIVNTYDYATALGLLYVHVLRRRIDEGGLQSRIHRLGVDPGDFDEIIFEVLASDETQTRYKANQEAGFPDLAPLRAWTGLRAPG